jgi:hypothetical protein
MTTWAITSAAERAALRPDNAGEVTFTVTNSGPVADEAVFDVVPGDTAAATWFTVPRQNERVEPGKSVQFTVTATIPPGTPAGSYWLQGRVYSASTAPEETSALSNRVMLEVAAAPVKARPWWLLAVVGLVVVVLVAVGAFLFLRPKDVAVPDLTAGTTTLPQATEKLEALGLKLGKVRYRQQPSDAGSVVQQSLTPNSPVAKDTAVDLVVAVSLPAPTLDSPGDGISLAVTAAIPPLAWKQAEHAATYLVDVRKETCNLLVVLGRDRCGFGASTPVTTEQTSFTPALTFTPAGPIVVGDKTRIRRFAYDTGRVQWRVTAVDEFGNPGPPSDYFTFTKQLK